jgi:hypothetical protein
LAQQLEKTLMPCLIGLAGMNCLKEMAWPLYRIIDSSTAIRMPMVHRRLKTYVKCYTTPFTLPSGSQPACPLLGILLLSIKCRKRLCLMKALFVIEF